MAIKESILHNTLSVDEFREFEQYSHELHFAPVKTEPIQEKPTEAPPAEKAESVQKVPEVKPFVFERVDRSVLYEQENRRRKQEQEREAQREEITAEQPVPVQPKPTVHVVKAEETDKLDVSLFENPFDNAFDEEITKLEKVTKHDFKPLDDIFSFGTSDDNTDVGKNTDDLNVTPDKQTYYNENEKSDSTDISRNNGKSDKPSVDTGFAGAFAKADYNRSSYAASVYKHTAEVTQNADNAFDTSDEEYPEIQQNGARLTNDDFDILPSSSVTEAKPSAKEMPALHGEPQKHEPPVIKLGVQTDDITDVQDIPGVDKRKRDGGSTMSRSTAKRLLDGIIKPTKLRNPFIDENGDE